MRRIPAGTFDMGCTPGQSYSQSDESPVMPVTLTHDYYIGETEVTNDEYESIMGQTPSYHGTTQCRSSSGGDVATTARCPVEQVTWHMVAAFTNALSTTAGLQECYACSGTGTGTWVGRAGGLGARCCGVCLG